MGPVPELGTAFRASVGFRYVITATNWLSVVVLGDRPKCFQGDIFKQAAD